MLHIGTMQFGELAMCALAHPSSWHIAVYGTCADHRRRHNESWKPQQQTMEGWRSCNVRHDDSTESESLRILDLTLLA